MAKGESCISPSNHITIASPLRWSSYRRQAKGNERGEDRGERKKESTSTILPREWRAWKAWPLSHFIASFDPALTDRFDVYFFYYFYNFPLLPHMAVMYVCISNLFFFLLELLLSSTHLNSMADKMDYVYAISSHKHTHPLTRKLPRISTSFQFKELLLFLVQSSTIHATTPLFFNKHKSKDSRKERKKVI